MTDPLPTVYGLVIACGIFYSYFDLISCRHYVLVRIACLKSLRNGPDKALKPDYSFIVSKLNLSTRAPININSNSLSFAKINFHPSRI